jgi:hypothetical protein
MQNNACGVDYGMQVRPYAALKGFDQHRFQMLSADIGVRISATGANSIPRALKQFLDLGNDKFAAGAVNPGSDGDAQQQLVHGRYFSKDALQIRLIHFGISAQRWEGCQSTIRYSVALIADLQLREELCVR